MAEKKYIFGIDEYIRDDFFLIGGAVATEKQLRALDRKWTALRVEIKRDLLKAKPKLADHKLLRGDQLPEIHAADLFQSGSYYRLNEKIFPEYWLRQYEWLERAAQIIKHYEIQFIHHLNPRDWDLNLKNADQFILDFDEHFGPFDSKSLDEIKARATHPYIRTFVGLIAMVDGYLNQRGGTAEIFCDEYDAFTDFSILDCYDQLRQLGHFNIPSNPGFYPSHTTTIIQVADVSCYLLGKSIFQAYERNKNPSHENERAFPIISDWYRKYINPTDLRATKYGVPGEVIPANPHVQKLVFAEMILARADVSKAARETGKQFVQHLLSNITPNEPEPVAKANWPRLTPSYIR